MPSPATRPPEPGPGPPPGRAVATPRTPSSWAAARSARGARTSCASGVGRVILLEKRTLGQGASSRAAGIVRTQGGTKWAVQLGEWSRRFYLRQSAELGIDSGFTPQGYTMPCFTAADIPDARERMAMQTRGAWTSAGRSRASWTRLNPAMAPGLTVGGTYCPDDGYLTPPRNVTAYAVALATSGVQVRERVTFTGLAHRGRAGHRSADQRGADRRADRGADRRPRAGRGRQAGRRPGRRPAGVRHQVAVTEPHPDLAAGTAADGLRPARRAVLAPRGRRPALRHEQPGRAAGRGDLHRRALPGADPRRLAELVPVTAGLGLRRVWAATIDYTPDHLPIIGPRQPRARMVNGAVVAVPAATG